MDFDPVQPGPASPNPVVPPAAPVGIQPPAQSEQQVRTMRTDLSAAARAASAFETSEPAFTPETTIPEVNNPAVPSVEELMSEEKPHSSWPLVGTIIGIIVVLGLGGYFFVYPMFNKNIAVPTTPTTPVVTLPITTTTSTTPVAPVHVSQFINPPIATVTERLVVGSDGSVQVTDINGALVRQAQTAKPGLTEIVFTSTTGSPISFGMLLAALAGTPAPSSSLALLQNDVTAFIYKDDQGAWPGYSAQFTVGTANNAMSIFAAQLEKLQYKNFFIVDPGALHAFKSGLVNTTPDRYAPGTTAGASFGYLATKNHLLISTSFAGMKEALRLMGL